MNNVLQLKGEFQSKAAPKNRGPLTLPAGSKVTKLEVTALRDDLNKVIKFWKNEKRVAINALVEVHYNTVIAKSNRIRRLLAENGTDSSNTIVGARFEDANTRHPKHVITHYVSRATLQKTSNELLQCAQILGEIGGSIDSDGLKRIVNPKNAFPLGRKFNLGKTVFAQILRDVHYVRCFSVPQGGYEGDTQYSEEKENKNSRLITFYDIKQDARDLLRQLGIDVLKAETIDRITVRLNADQYHQLMNEAPYLVAIKMPDMSQLIYEPHGEGSRDTRRIPSPGNEPIVGVIDFGFDSSVYFSDWVDYHDEVDPEIRAGHESIKDFAHGTEVTSLIVDGPSLNPELDDGCGRFRVCHFAVAVDGKNSIFTMYRKIQSIVKNNQNIKVWNLSLGSEDPIFSNAISSVASLLDELQHKYDVLFVVAGTNKKRSEKEMIKPIGSPADSINSVVINAVTKLGKSASYTRVGPVLSFFRKPDIAYFGGDDEEPMWVYGPNGITPEGGTSFAAPWIARKLAYLIGIMGLTRETAKALLIDAAAGWQPSGKDGKKIGYGIVPRRIEDILKTPDDEIRFVFHGIVNDFETYNYRIPVPMNKNKYQYTARATLCYFPECQRSQGVDYTDTELDFYFGRMDGKGVRSLEKNEQDSEEAFTFEGDARKLNRKWDNVKHLSDVPKSIFIPRSTFGQRFWGFKIRKIERSNTQKGKGLHFSVVVTLREMEGKNRIDEFKQRCQASGWDFTELNMKRMIDVYQAADVDIDFVEDVHGDADV
ncbi:S8 family peptidase [Bifidobacterium sp. ESL0775]|uniref:S8 family peptidase n=1 Tax=Bifidobacterium sp. ESL0775 TaxID=2983230 RepID=UPI0023F6FD59|nr:S8 family peptidase [Bifidobacterium sp. ESL0775]WEV69556.1 S8 family peptidase [Bifidobacterium sp. ESL0775]